MGTLVEGLGHPLLSLYGRGGWLTRSAVQYTALYSTVQDSTVWYSRQECRQTLRLAHRDELVDKGVPDVGIDAVDDPVELVEVPLDGRVLAHLLRVRGGHLQPRAHTNRPHDTEVAPAVALATTREECLSSHNKKSASAAATRGVPQQPQQEGPSKQQREGCHCQSGTRRTWNWRCGACPGAAGH